MSESGGNTIIQQSYTYDNTDLGLRNRAARRLQRVLEQAEMDDFLRVNRDKGWVWCAEQLGVPVTQVRSRVVRIGIQQKKRKPPNYGEFMDLYDSGASCQDLVEHFNCSFESVRNFLRKHGLPTPIRDEKRRMAKFRETVRNRYGVDNPQQLLRKRRREWIAEVFGWKFEHPGASVTAESLSRLGVPSCKHDIRNEYIELRREYERSWFPAGEQSALKWCKWLQDRGHVVVDGTGNRLRYYSLCPQLQKEGAKWRSKSQVK